VVACGPCFGLGLPIISYSKWSSRKDTNLIIISPFNNPETSWTVNPTVHIDPDPDTIPNPDRIPGVYGQRYPDPVLVIPIFIDTSFLVTDLKVTSVLPKIKRGCNCVSINSAELKINGTAFQLEDLPIVITK